MKYPTLTLLAVVLLIGCEVLYQRPVYELPMYVGIDKSSSYQLTEKDKLFVHEAISGYFIDLDKASLTWAAKGFQYFEINELQFAMQAFNKAWLLNSKNPNIYWGYAMVLGGQNRYCKAQVMADWAYAEFLRTEKFLVDVAFIYTACALEDETLTKEQRKKRLAWSDDLFHKTYSSRYVDKEYALLQWARALIIRGDIEGAKKRIFALEKITGDRYRGALLLQLNSAPAEPDK